MGTVAAMRNYHLLSPLAERNKVHVISAKFKYSKYPGTYDKRVVKRYESPNIDYRSMQMLLRFFFKSNDRTARKTVGDRDWMRKLMDSFPTHLLFGEGGILYILHAYLLAINIIRRHEINCMYSSFRTHADHVVAALIKYTRRDIIWIADFADFPVDPTIGNTYAPSLQHWYLRTLLKRADVVTAVSKGIIDNLPVSGQSTGILPNGIDPQYQSLSFEPFEKFTISYTGSLYANRTPAPLFNVLRRLIDEQRIQKDDLQIVYVGNHPSTWNKYLCAYNLQEFARVQGVVDHAEVRKIQSRSHINLLLTWASQEIQGWMTYKVYEYIQTGRPILGIIYGSRDAELDTLLHKYSDTLLVHHGQDSDQKLEHFVLEKYGSYVRGEALSAPNLDGFHEVYAWPQISKKLAAYFGN